MTLLLDCVIRTSAILAAALAIAGLLRKQSAGMRHAVLAVGLFAAAVAPVATLALPAWHLHWAAAAPPPPVDVHVTIAPESRTSVHAALPPHPPEGRAAGRLYNAVWLSGFAAAALMIVVGFARVWRIASFSVRVEEGPWAEAAQAIAQPLGLRRRVALRETRNRKMLVTWGVLRPQILLPLGSRSWPQARIEAVLGHEFAHIRRCDWLLQTIAEVVCAVYWFCPLFHLVCRRLRLESEYACDDAVIAQGVAGSKYAGHLLDVAQGLHEESGAWSAALPMARPSTIQRRVTAMLNPRMNRNPVTRLKLLVVIAAAVCLTLPAATMRLSAKAQAQNDRGRISGNVVDNAGTKVTGATVVLTTPDGRTVGTAVTNAEGGFVFAGLPANNYVLQVFAAGFGPSRLTPAELPPGKDVKADVRMDIGYAKPPAPQRTPQYAGGGALVSVRLQDANIHDFFSLIADFSGLNILLDPDVKGTVSTVTLDMKDVSWEQVLDAVAKNNQLTTKLQGNILLVSAPVRLNLDLYKNDALIGSPQLRLADGGKGVVTAGGLVTEVVPQRDGTNGIELTVSMMANGQTAKFVVPMTDRTGSVQWNSGTDAFEVRLTVVRNP